jgi:thiosulfate dehydrogenase
MTWLALLLTATPLIDAKADLDAPVVLPKNPFADPSANEEVRLGYRIFTTVSGRADLACSNCHLDAGQKDKALPLMGSGVDLGMIVRCFERNLGTTPDEPTARAVAAYLRWLSHGEPPLQRRNVVKAETAQGNGGELFQKNCSACHGADGQGSVLPVINRRVPPLWGEHTWTSTSEFADARTLAGFIRWAMPYWAPGSLSDEQALAIAAFIDAQPRPGHEKKPKPSARAMR